MVRLLVVGDQHVKASLLCRELLLHLLDRHVLCLLDDPEMEALSLHDEVILVADLLLNLFDGITWESRNDTVNEGSAYVAVLCEPLLETLIFSAHISLPKLNILIDAVLKMVTIEEDEAHKA